MVYNSGILNSLQLCQPLLATFFFFFFQTENQLAVIISVKKIESELRGKVVCTVGVKVDSFFHKLSSRCGVCRTQ